MDLFRVQNQTILKKSLVVALSPVESSYRVETGLAHFSTCVSVKSLDRWEFEIDTSTIKSERGKDS